jgi:hypothetical protein
MLRFVADKKDFLVSFGCCTVNVSLFRSGGQRKDPKLRPLFNSAWLRLEPTCAPKFGEQRMACAMDERPLLRGSNLSRFVLGRRARYLPFFRRQCPTEVLINAVTEA